MATKLKNPKAKELSKLKGLSVIVFFKTTSIVDQDNGTVGKGVSGYLLDVTDEFVYMGFQMSDPDNFDTMIALDEVGIVRVPDDIEQILSIMGDLKTNPDNGEMQ